MIKRISRHIERSLLHSSRYRWYVFTPRVSRETMQPLLCRYGLYAAGGRYMQRNAEQGEDKPVARRVLAEQRALKSKRVVYLCDGQTIYGGLADRFKGILSLYALCRDLGYDFRIHFVSPCCLEDYLEPADYDWRIAADDLHYDQAAMLVLENTDDASYQTHMQEKWLRRRLEEGPAEIHVVTNSNYAYDLDYAALFRTLFRPSAMLEDALQKEQAALGDDYISVSARFLTMLGDFQETAGNTALPADEAEALIKATLAQIEYLHDRHPQSHILVNSDSTRFLRRASVLPYVHVVEGGVAHTDLMETEGAARMHLKLFLDFILISRASRVYLLRTGLMRESGYPYAASRIGGKTFEVVEF